jgi:hypothetical protein
MELKKQFIRTLFLHHDGIIVGSTLAALKAQGLYDFLLNKGVMSERELKTFFPCKPGYLRVAMRCLASQGWVEIKNGSKKDGIVFKVTKQGFISSKALDLYSHLFNTIYANPSMQHFIYKGEKLEDKETINQVKNLIHKAVMQWDLIPSEKSEEETFDIIKYHLDGMLIAPFMVTLKKHGHLDQARIDLNMSNSNHSLNMIRPLFEKLGWILMKEPFMEFTEMGRIASRYALHYGLTLSYLSTLSRLQEIIFTAAPHQTHTQTKAHEKHVDRTLNVIASGEAHKTYFHDAKKIFIDIFNQEPIAQQPQFIMDTGSGDGTWLAILYDLIKMDTKRGQYLSDYPLLMIGADYNLKAQEATYETLKSKNIPSLVIFGDIGNPYQMSLKLRKHGIGMVEGLHVRAFIDHNRPYSLPLGLEEAYQRKPLSTGVYVDENGQTIPNSHLEQQFVEHFGKWMPYISKHGLIVIEAHNINPTIAAQNIGNTHAIAFDTYHGYSHQYPIDYKAYIQLIEEAGLKITEKYQNLYPKNLPFVAISLNYLRVSNPPFTNYPENIS